MVPPVPKCSKYEGLYDTILYSVLEPEVLGVVGVVGELPGGGGGGGGGSGGCGGGGGGGGSGGELLVQKFVLTPPVRIPSSIRAKKTQLMIRSKLMITRMHRPTPRGCLRSSFFTGGETMGSTFVQAGVAVACLSARSACCAKSAALRAKSAVSSASSAALSASSAAIIPRTTRADAAAGRPARILGKPEVAKP